MKRMDGGIQRRAPSKRPSVPWKVKEGRDDKGDRHGKSLLLTQELVGNITELYLELLWGQHSSHSTCLCVGIVTSKDLRVENLGKCGGHVQVPRLRAGPATAVRSLASDGPEHLPTARRSFG